MVNCLVPKNLKNIWFHKYFNYLFFKTVNAYTQSKNAKNAMRDVPKLFLFLIRKKVNILSELFFAKQINRFFNY